MYVHMYAPMYILFEYINVTLYHCTFAAGIPAFLFYTMSIAIFAMGIVYTILLFSNAQPTCIV